MMRKKTYADAYRNVDFRKHPELYVIGKGEQGVLIAEPYKSEILPYWRFKTPQEAQISANKIYDLFLHYKKEDDFVGMDMARKYLQMGYTRSRRYANHKTGRKWDDAKERVLPRDVDDEKALSAQLFLEKYLLAKDDEKYLALKAAHLANQKPKI